MSMRSGGLMLQCICPSPVLLSASCRRQQRQPGGGGGSLPLLLHLHAARPLRLPNPALQQPRREPGRAAAPARWRARLCAPVCAGDQDGRRLPPRLPLADHYQVDRCVVYVKRCTLLSRAASKQQSVTLLNRPISALRHAVLPCAPLPPHLGDLRRIGVNVFGMSSRKESLILQLKVSG